MATSAGEILPMILGQRFGCERGRLLVALRARDRDMPTGEHEA